MNQRGIEKSVCARFRAAVPGGAAFEARASFHSGENAPNTFVISPFGPVPVFSSTTLAPAAAPQSHPARVYGTHGAGVFLGELGHVLFKRAGLIQRRLQLVTPGIKGFLDLICRRGCR